jgi:hypothetical protein
MGLFAAQSRVDPLLFFMGKFILYQPIEGEILKDIEGYEGRYMVTNHARIVTFNINDQGHVCYQGWKGGYKNVKLTAADGAKWHALVHVLVALAFVPNPDPINKTEVNHIDTVKTHNWPLNLEWTTHKENMEHAGKMGLMASGEKHHWTKLNAELVLAIFNSRLSSKALSLIHGVAKSCIQAIKEGKSWSAVTGKVYKKKYDLLTDEQVIQIFYSSGTNKEIASKFGITHEHVGRIKKKVVRLSLTRDL